MLLELTKTSGAEIAINLDKIWKVDETDYGCIISVGTKTIALSTSYADVMTAGSSALQEFTSGNNTFALNVNFIDSTSPFAAGGSTILLSNGNVVYVDEDVADIVADQPASGGGSSYLVYTALLSQSGTDAPVATVLENTLGGTVVWSRSGVGQYSADLAGVFTANKTTVFTGDTGGTVYSGRTDNDSVFVNTNDSAGTMGDEYLLETIVEIRVYP